MILIIFRFCLSETSCPQEDHFPPNLCVKVNGKPCNLPVSLSLILLWFSVLCVFFLICYCEINVLCVYLFFFLFAGISPSHKKWGGTKKAQPSYKHNVSCPAIYHCPQHYCGVLDIRNWKGEITVSECWEIIIMEQYVSRLHDICVLFFFVVSVFLWRCIW